MRIEKKKDILSKNFFVQKGLKARKKFFSNSSDSGKKAILGHLISVETPYLKINFEGERSNSEGVELRLISLDRKWVSEPVDLNTETLIRLREEVKTKRYLLYVKIPAKKELKLKRLEVTPWSSYSLVEKKNFANDVLVITPMYPSVNRPYSATFVYSKVKEYAKNGIKTDVVVATNNESRLYRYQFKGQWISKVSFDDLRNIIQTGHHKKILVHFLDRQIGNALLACDLDDKEVMIYCHGADVDLWNLDIFGEYFKSDRVFTEDENAFRRDRLDVLRMFNNKENVKWIFNTEWNYKNSKKVTGLDFKNHEIIPCVIDKKDFVFTRRNDGLKRNILVLKKMDNVRQYAVDLAVRIIMRLSKKDYFNELHFTVAGAGDFQQELTHPLKEFNNVEIVDKFYDHEEMNRIFSENGILLAPSRYDTQGVTAGEAAMSGMVVVASTNTGLSDMYQRS